VSGQGRGGQPVWFPAPEEGTVSGHMKVAIGGVAVGLILLIFLPWEISLLIIAAAIALPAAAYFMLDPSQRRRLGRIRSRKQIGR